MFVKKAIKMQLLIVHKKRPLKFREMRLLNVVNLRLLRVRKMCPLSVRKIS